MHLVRSWTRSLMARLLRDGGVTMRVDGPYGEEEERPEWTYFSTLVIFAGGIGVRGACIPKPSTLNATLNPRCSAPSGLTSARWSSSPAASGCAAPASLNPEP